ncbi:MAG: imidazole glycerol phosphate synthase subunit HisH [Treponema sp.]|jgi:imidazole glycerol phosphate synthase glutamine amidotransferase subunit|nr:imidazole glycerol phosphate synthase subunit HisH [Treponema sp.]
MIGVINYGAGNLGSVMNALTCLGVKAGFVPGPDEIRRFDRIIFPGDGHFGTAIDTLEKTGYDDAIREWIKSDRPFLGICIGLQLLFESSEEAPPVDSKTVRGLSVIQGTVKKFSCRKVPQIGWNSTVFRKGSRLFPEPPMLSFPFFYYIHSFYVEPTDHSIVVAEADYSVRFCAAVERSALCAVQFHPEKSGAAGLKLLDNWLHNY